ncbi:hypothetical protein Cgig2_013428 [Carnegiea gigantea]|uniref:Uncharacterized protein n=1 Tax=Carnegiea gigantea TaxID=171969 RepID=A0A9Q1JY16_9CARY|nr:hypothetical protein Cgig2_013428 [Carnegiea gigantea]
MGIANRPLLLGLALVMVLGTAVYFRLWIIDYKISAVDAELLRREFDLANKEAVDESAEWRYRFDKERERANKCIKELTESGLVRGKNGVLVIADACLADVNTWCCWLYHFKELILNKQSCASTKAVLQIAATGRCGLMFGMMEWKNELILMLV